MDGFSLAISREMKYGFPQFIERRDEATTLIELHYEAVKFPFKYPCSWDKGKFVFRSL
jgi:hypothetical protein